MTIARSILHGFLPVFLNSKIFLDVTEAKKKRPETNSLKLDGNPSRGRTLLITGGKNPLAKESAATGLVAFA